MHTPKIVVLNIKAQRKEEKGWPFTGTEYAN